MKTRRIPSTLATASAAALLLTLAACGGGSGEAPPQAAGSVVVAAAPVATITNNAGELASAPVTFTFSFNRDVGTSFTADDITVTGGTKGAFARESGTKATLVVTPNAASEGNLQVSIAAGAVLDAAGTANAAVSASKAYSTVIRTALMSFEENPAPRLVGFGGAEDATVVADPTNAANKVVRVVKSATAEVWAGTTMALCPNDAIPALPFTGTLRTLSARVWSPVAGVPVRMKLENAADGTKSVETEATVTVASGWQTLNFNFANHVTGTSALNLATVYNKASVFFNFGTGGAATGARTYYLDDMSFVGATFAPACPVVVVPPTNTNSHTITMDEGTAPVLTGFGGAEDASIVADPAGGTNQVARVLKSATAEVWAGTTVSNAAGLSIARIGFSNTAKTIAVRVWSPAANVPVRLKVENAADPTKSVETEATVTTANAWQTLTFNFANQAAGTAALDLALTYNKMSIFFNFGTGGAATGARTYYFEEVVYPSVTATAPSANTNTIMMDEATAPVLTGFGGAEDASVVTDPAGGTNKVARVLKSATAEVWAGTTVSNAAGMSIARVGFSDSAKTITVRVWSPAANVPVRLKVENATDGSKSVETEATVTTANAWQTLTFNFATQAAGTAALDLAQTYNKMSIFFNFGTGGAATGARTYYFEEIVYPAVSSTPPSTPTLANTINFESATAPTLAGFGGAEDAAVVVDPTNAANKLARMTKSATAETWAGTTISTGAGNSISRIAFAAGNTTITARVWSPVAGIPVRMKVEDATDPNKSVETEATVTTAGGWQTLSFNFSNQATGTAALNLAFNFTRLSVFFNFGTAGAATGARTYFIDDISYP